MSVAQLSSKIKETRNCGNCDALQLEATPVLTRFNYDAHAKFEVAQPIRCRAVAFLLLIRYVTLWPWPLTLWPWLLTT